MKKPTKKSRPASKPKKITIPYTTFVRLVGTLRDIVKSSLPAKRLEKWVLEVENFRVIFYRNTDDVWTYKINEIDDTGEVPKNLWPDAACYPKMKGRCVENAKDVLYDLILDQYGVPLSEDTAY